MYDSKQIKRIKNMVTKAITKKELYKLGEGDVTRDVLKESIWSYIKKDPEKALLYADRIFKIRKDLAQSIYDSMTKQSDIDNELVVNKTLYSEADVILVFLKEGFTSQVKKFKELISKNKDLCSVSADLLFYLSKQDFSKFLNDLTKDDENLAKTKIKTPKTKTQIGLKKPTSRKKR
ncbi:MAG: hypothetical protein LBF44_01895 [Holosporaceae bacterium]|nr:hypothetical protein [Holosporaceae bacterium]